MLHGGKKILISGLLAIALYYAATCPCETYLECHRWQYNGALITALLLPELLWKTGQ